MFFFTKFSFFEGTKIGIPFSSLINFLPFASSYHSFYFGLGFGRDNFKNSGFWSELIKNKREICLDDANGKKLIKDENGIPILVPSIKGKLGIKKTTGWFSKELFTLDGKILKLPWFAMDGKVYVLDGNFIYTRPIRTDNYYIYLKEYIQLNDRLSGILGIRYDKIKHNLKAVLKLYSKKVSSKISYFNPAL